MQTVHPHPCHAQALTGCWDSGPPPHRPDPPAPPPAALSGLSPSTGGRPALRPRTGCDGCHGRPAAEGRASGQRSCHSCTRVLRETTIAPGNSHAHSTAGSGSGSGTGAATAGAATAAHLSKCRPSAALVAEAHCLCRCYKLIRLHLGQAAGYLHAGVASSSFRGPSHWHVPHQSQAGRHRLSSCVGLCRAFRGHDELSSAPTSIMKSSESRERACRSDLGAMRGHLGGGGPAGSGGGGGKLAVKLASGRHTATCHIA